MDSKENTKSLQYAQAHFRAVIGVCGAADISDEVYAIAEELGRKLTENGYAVACGGLYGTMEAVCKGAKSIPGKGLTIGILPVYDRSYANKYVDLVIPTGIGEARNMILVSTAEYVVTIAGGAGTLSEIALAWKIGKPICSLVSTGGWSEYFGGKRVDDSRWDKITSCNTPDEVIEVLNKYFASLRR